MRDKFTFGSYWPGESVIHRLDARAKMLLCLALVVIIFCAGTWAGLALCALFILGLYGFAHIPPHKALRAVAPLLFIVVVTVLLNLFFIQGGEVLFNWAFITISEKGVWQAAFMGVRLALLLFAVSLLTLTTTTIDITDAFEKLLSPFAKRGFPAHELAMMMGIALRFLPQFAFEWQSIYRAQISRGASFSNNPFKGGAQAASALVIPLFASVFRHAETLANAMDARCYHGSNRTKLKPLRYTKNDAFAAIVLVVLLAAVVTLNFI